MSPAPRSGSFPQSLDNAVAGLRHGLRSQRNLRIHTVIGAVVVAAGFALGVSRVEWAIVISLIALVVALELLNTAVEALADLASPEFHPLAKTAKDTAAAAILVAAAGSAVAGLFIFLPRVWRIFL